MRTLEEASYPTRTLEEAAKSMIDLEGASDVILALEQAPWLYKSHRDNLKLNNSLKESP